MPELLLPYARRISDGLMVPPSAVPRGAACGCVCPECDAPLIAAQGDVLAWHFKHHPGVDTARCAVSAPETITHQLAKDTILANAQILIPHLTAQHGSVARTVHTARHAAYTVLESERMLRDIRRKPDVLLQCDGRELLVEIFVAHRVGPEKQADIARRGSPAIEINLSDWKGQRAPATAVLTSAQRLWLFHPDLAPATEKLIEEHRSREAARAAAAQRQREHEAALLAARKAELDRFHAEEDAKRADREAALQEARAAQAANMAHLQAERERQHALTQAQRAAERLAADDARGISQRCTVCTKPYSPFGFGPPLTPTTVWACRDHRREVDAQLTNAKANP